MSIEPEVDEDEDEPCIPVGEAMWFVKRAARVGTFTTIVGFVLGVIIGLNLHVLWGGL